MGLPSVGFANTATINKIIVNQKSGFLVKDIDDYAEKLDVLMSNPELRKKLGEFGRKDIQKRYSSEIVINR